MLDLATALIMLTYTQRLVFVKLIIGLIAHLHKVINWTVGREIGGRSTSSEAVEKKKVNICQSSFIPFYSFTVICLVMSCSPILNVIWYLKHLGQLGIVGTNGEMCTKQSSTDFEVDLELNVIFIRMF